MSLLSIENISKAYGNFWAVNHVSFSLEAGKILALIGPNGAGKSTIFNAIGGQTKVNTGHIWFEPGIPHSVNGNNQINRVDLQDLSSEQIYSLGISRTFQVAEVFSSLTVQENVQLALQMASGQKLSLWNRCYLDKQEEAIALLKDVEMQDYAKLAASDMAYGDIKRLELAMALANRPQLLLMDEPTAGMSPVERMAMMALTKRISQERNMSVLFTEHSMEVVFAFADYIVVMAAGSLIAAGTPDQIRDNPVVKQVYLGGLVR